MTDNLAPYLSPKAVLILQMFKQYTSIENLQLAHPEITDEIVMQVTVEVAAAMQKVAGISPASKQPGKRGKKGSQGGSAHQLKITLRGSKPPIWRRVVVPSEIMLADLHDVIQLAMGWDDCHLHLFEINGRCFQGRSPDGYRDDSMDFEDASEYRLCDVVDREKAKFRYEYDFGDSWEHVILVEKIIPAAEKPKLMVCTAGKGCCPMEDSGGIWGYYEKLAILADPTHPEHNEIREWVGDDFNPVEFDPAVTSKALAKGQSAGCN